MRETKEHTDAYNQYYLMGAKRSFVSAAGQCGVSERTIARWAKEFSWKERIVLQDIQNSREDTKNVNAAVVNTKADYRKMIKERLEEDIKLDGYATAIIDKAKEMIESGELKVSSIKELAELMRVHHGSTAKKVELMKLDLLMIGEADGREEQIIIVNDLTGAGDED